MHPLQQHILYMLITKPKLRYARLKPAEVEGNHFMYYLKKLMREGLVTKNESGEYELSPKGKNFADRLSLKTFTPRVQPRMVTLIALQNEAGEWLMYRRHRQPLLGKIGFPYGKMHLGETIKAAAARELEEKTGLQAELTHRGDGYATIYESEEPVSQIFFHLFSGRNPYGTLKTYPDSMQIFWSHQDDFKSSDYIPTVPDLIRLLKQNNDHFFVELEHKL